MVPLTSDIGSALCVYVVPPWPLGIVMWSSPCGLTGMPGTCQEMSLEGRPMAPALLAGCHSIMAAINWSVDFAPVGAQVQAYPHWPCISAWSLPFLAFMGAVK
jgi:hypothetical protein